MNTFYRPGLVEMFLHGVFGRHSWFIHQYEDAGRTACWTITCRICLEYKIDAETFTIHTAK